MSIIKESLTAATSSGDDWICVSDDSQSTQAIKELKSQLGASRGVLYDFQAVASNLQNNLSVLTTEVIRLQKVEQEAKELKNTVESLQKSYDDLKTKVALTAAAASDEQAKAQQTFALNIPAVTTEIPELAMNPRRDQNNFVSWCVKIQPTVNAISWLEDADQAGYVVGLIRHTCKTRSGSYATCEEKCGYHEFRERFVDGYFASVKDVLQYIGREVYGLSQVL